MQTVKLTDVISEKMHRLNLKKDQLKQIQQDIADLRQWIEDDIHRFDGFITKSNTRYETDATYTHEDFGVVIRGAQLCDSHMLMDLFIEEPKISDISGVVMIKL